MKHQNPEPIETATITGEDNIAITLSLFHDDDQRYRWYQQDGSDTEISGHTHSGAIETAKEAWRQWGFALVQTARS